jgi:transcriptional regulator with XRE-family HTH domain
MNTLQLSENIISLRREKGITQEDLANFLGVTKASVSKWETKQSYPDILLLPQIATYFNVTVDELIGYEPQLSPEQIKKYYLTMAEEFSTQPFEETMKKCQSLVKEYYACYELQLQMVKLWLNHFMLTPDHNQQMEILSDAVELCDHIGSNSKNMELCNEALMLKQYMCLQLGRAKEVVETLEPTADPKHLMYQKEDILIQAYQMTGETDKAKLYNQISVYMQLLSFIGKSIELIGLNMTEFAKCEQTISRIQQVIKAYNLEELHPNITLQFNYQTAAFYSIHQKKEQALQALQSFVDGSVAFIQGGVQLHGDGYFDRIEEWFGTFDLDVNAPRTDKVILESLEPAIQNPVLSILFDMDEYKKLQKKLKRTIQNFSKVK